MNRYDNSIVEHKLTTLHNDAKLDFIRIDENVIKTGIRPERPSDFSNAYLPISKKQGEDIRNIIIQNNCRHVVEFGSSFGISTIYLADAVRQIGGKVVSTELIESKAERAIHHLKEVGLETYVEVKIGDAMQSLKGYNHPIDFLLLDGWKDLYLPLFRMLEPVFYAGTIIYADNMDMMGTEQYAKYLSSHTCTYVTERLHSGKGFLTRVL